jgi:hypothetical protein
VAADPSRERTERNEVTERTEPRAPAGRAPTAPGPEPTPLLGALPHLLRFGRDSIGTAGRLFERYGPLAQLVRAPARIMSPGGRFCVVANGPALNREVLTQHERYRMYALPGTFFPEERDLLDARAKGGSRGRPTEERLRPIQRTLTGLFTSTVTSTAAIAASSSPRSTRRASTRTATTWSPSPQACSTSGAKARSATCTPT